MANGTCSVIENGERCDRPIHTLGWCSMHWKRWRRHGDPLILRKAHHPSDGLCIIDGCVRSVKAQGWCDMHYQRWKRHGDPLGTAVVSPYERVMRRTERQGECLVFTGSANSNGYGQVGLGGKPLLAHRVVMEHHHGPSDLFVLHHCDNPPCVEIEHLRYGTNTDNMADMVDRDRSRSATTPTQRAEIRAKHAAGGTSYGKLAVEYGVSKSAIRNVILGTTFGGH